MAKNQFTGEIIHAGAVRLRLLGFGTFKPSLFSLDPAISVDLPNITMASVSAREPTVLANFNQQKFCVAGRVTIIGESFSVSRIVVFVRAVSTGYPTV